MSKTQVITSETLKTISQGALGAMTFGAYHQYNTNKIMDLNNEKIEIQHKYFMDKMETQHKKEMAEMETCHKKEMTELNEKLEKLEKAFKKKNMWW
jgi:polyhydroxyalkanoate synthesis regulator phasin